MSSAEMVRESNLCFIIAKDVFIGAWYWRGNFTRNISCRTEESARYIGNSSLTQSLYLFVKLRLYSVCEFKN